MLRRRWAVVLVGLVAVVTLVVFRHAIGKAAIGGVLSVASGYRASVDDFSVGWRAAELRGLRLQRNGVTVVSVAGVGVRYDLRDALPGGTRRFWLSAVDLERPELTIHRAQDGSIDVGGFGGAPSRAPSGAAPSGTPLRFTVRVRDGRATLLDPYRSDPVSRSFVFANIAADASVNSGTRTQYSATAAYDALGVLYPVRADGVVDAVRGFALHDVRAAAFPLRELANYFINGHVASLEMGDVRDVRFRVYSLDGARYHISGSADLTGVQLAVTALRYPLRALSGRVYVYDDGLSAPHLTASIGGLPLQLAGGLFAFDAPRIRLGIATDSTLQNLRTLFDFSRRQPISGDVGVRVLLEGPVGEPLILTRVSSDGAMYGTIPIARIDGTVAYYQSSVDAVPLALRYGGVDVLAHGAFVIGPHLFTDAVARADAPASALPYAAETVPRARIRATGLLAGVDGQFATRGIIAGAGGGDSLAGLFHIDTRGNGELGPILASRGNGTSVAAALILNRSQSRSAFWMDARALRFETPQKPPRLPGLPSVAPPVFSGTIDGALGGIGPPSAFAVAGRIRVTALTVAGVHIDRADGDVLGSPSDIRFGRMTAAGPWGTFAGAGVIAGGNVGMRGRYEGSFQRLESFTGKLGGLGAVSAPVAMVVGPAGTVVQTTGARTPGATLHGVPLDDLTGTLAVGGAGVRIYAASASASGATVAAAGGLGPARTLGLAATNADATGLRGIGLPLERGTVSAIGAAVLAPGGIRFDGGAVVEGGRYDRFPVAGNGDVSAGGPTVRLGDVDAKVGPVFASGGGSLLGAGTSAPRYDLDLRVRGADLGDAAAAFAKDMYHLDGSADADLHVAGAGAAPQVTGRVTLPEATVNGLFIDGAAARVRVAPSLIALDGGSATVGSTVTRFEGAWRPRRSLSLSVEANRADLSDFNDFFDPGDLLSGRGRVAFSFARSRGRAQTGGDVSLSTTRIAHFDFGTIGAAWTSSGSRIDGQGGFTGRLGRLQTNGSVDLATRGSIRRLIARADFNLRLSASGLDMGAWLPALGYDLPVGGRIDADGTLSGRFPALALSGNASVNGGTFGKLPIGRLALSASSNVSRTTIHSLELDVGGISARGSGSFGYSPSDPLSFNVHASSADVGAVVAALTGNKLPLHGAMEADLRAEGRPTKPSVSGGFEVENGALAGVAIPRMLGEFGLNGRNVELRDVEVGFATGTLYLAGAIPLTLSPLGVGPAHAPITLEAAPKNIDLADFKALLPPGSRVQGTLDGRVAIRGTVDAPSLEGALSLTGGELVASGFEQQPLRNVAGTLSFAGTQVRLDRLHADAGPGAIDVTGSASFPDLVRVGGDATYDIEARFARAVLQLPTYGRGQLDGTVALRHVPGSLATISGSAALQDAIIPFAALYNPQPGQTDQFALTSVATTPFGLPDVAFNLALSAGRNVRVRSSVIDIGATGTVTLAGTLAAPQLAGAFDATDGTLTYFNRVFRLLDASVSFAPGAGIVPVLDARASAHVTNPDPSVKNLTGYADITLAVRGPVSNLSISLDSDPSYDRQQILGLLLSAPSIGASNLFEQQTLPGVPPPLSLAGTPTANGTVTVGQTAFGVLNAQFTRNLLSPLENTLGGALGLTNVNFNIDYTGSVGVSARKLLGKNVYAVYGTTFGYPYRQTFGFELRPTPTTAAQFTFFQTIGDIYGYVTSPVTGQVSRETLSQPITGTSGFSFSLQRFFW